jgi:NADH-quinone oxidoreductase subunit N
MTVMDFHRLLPYIVLGVGAVILLLLGAFWRGFGPRRLNLLGAAIALAAGIAAIYTQPSPAEIGNLLIYDSFGRFFTAAVSFIACVSLLFSSGYSTRRPIGDEEFPSLALFAAFGMSLLASSSNLIGVFLGLESMSLSLYVMLASNKSDPLSGESGLKYLIIGAISTAFFAYGLALIYTDTGTLSLAGSISSLSRGQAIGGVGLAGWAMLLVGLGFKTSLFPFHLWAPDVYQGAPAPTVGFLSTASKASVFAVFLKFTAAAGAAWGELSAVLWVMAVFTMAFGNIAALTQNNVKRLLAYSSIAQMGYVLVALIAAPESGQSAAIFYLVAYAAMELGAFGAIGAFSGKEGELGDIRALKGAGFRYPFRSAVLSLCLISLAGLPPTAGFIGKFGIFFSAMSAGYVWLSVIGILTAIVSVYYYLRVVVFMYMREEEKPSPKAASFPAVDFPAGIALAALSVIVIYLGIFPGKLLDLIASLRHLA